MGKVCTTQLFIKPPMMQKIASYSPMNWGLEGLLDVLLRSGDAASVLPEVGRLPGSAALMPGIAFGLFGGADLMGRYGPSSQGQAGYSSSHFSKL